MQKYYWFYHNGTYKLNLKNTRSVSVLHRAISLSSHQFLARHMIWPNTLRARNHWVGVVVLVRFFLQRIGDGSFIHPSLLCLWPDIFAFLFCHCFLIYYRLLNCSSLWATHAVYYSPTYIFFLLQSVWNWQRAGVLGHLHFLGVFLLCFYPFWSTCGHWTTTWAVPLSTLNIPMYLFPMPYLQICVSWLYLVCAWNFY